MDFVDILIHIAKWGTYVTFVLAFIVFGVITIIKFPKSIVKIGIAAVSLLIVVCIGYILANGETTILGKNYAEIENLNLTTTTSKRVGAGLFSVYILGGLAFVLLIADVVKGFIVNR